MHYWLKYDLQRCWRQNHYIGDRHMNLVTNINCLHHRCGRLNVERNLLLLMTKYLCRFYQSPKCQTFLSSTLMWATGVINIWPIPRPYFGPIWTIFLILITVLVRSKIWRFLVLVLGPEYPHIFVPCPILSDRHCAGQFRFVDHYWYELLKFFL